MFLNYDMVMLYFWNDINDFKPKKVLQIWPWSNCLNKLRKTANLSFSVYLMEVKNAHITGHVFP